MKTVYEEIQKEREHQDIKWGGPGEDDLNTDHNWIAYIIKQTGQAVTRQGDRSNFRQRMIRVAALAVAAIERCDRATEREGT